MFQKLAPLRVSADTQTVSLTVRPNEIYTLTTLTTGAKGAAKAGIPAAAPMALPFTQSFDDESDSAPPALWYDQMGAWEIQQGAGLAAGDKIMRQVVPVWPQCWGYSCTGPTTYWGPQEGSVLGAGVTVAVDVMVEAAAAFTIATDGGSNGFLLSLSTNGTFAFGRCPSHQQACVTGKLAFSPGKWHKLVVQTSSAWQAASVDGQSIANISSSDGHGWNIKVSLDRYVFAGMNNFKITK